MQAFTQAFDLMQLLGMATPVIVGVVSVPIFSGVKRLVGMIDNLPAWLQQLLVTVQTWALGSLSALVGVALPETLQGMTLDSTESLIAAGIAFAVHGGKKAKEEDES